MLEDSGNWETAKERVNKQPDPGNLENERRERGRERESWRYT